MQFKISNKIIGDNYPVFITAEVGINHNGVLKNAKSLIHEAKANGADAIKFQTFKASDLALPSSPFFNTFKKLEFGRDDFMELADTAKSYKIIFYSTPVSEEAVDVLMDLKVPLFKIASGDLTHIPLIKYVASKKKPIIISTGMADLNEVKYAIKTIESQKNSRIAIMHSVSSYPTPKKDANLRSILKLKEVFPYPVGYSDNGEGLLIPLSAVACGAKLIEKHFTLNKKMKGPDHRFSAAPKEFKEMVKKIREVEMIMGEKSVCCLPSERKNKFEARRGITTKISIEMGSKIRDTAIVIRRPASGIEPKDLLKIIGKTTRRTIRKNQSLKWSDLLE